MKRAIGLGFVSAAICFCDVAPVPNLRQLASEATDAIVGRIGAINVTQIATQPVSSVSVEVHVVRSLAGVLSPTQRIRLTWMQAGSVAVITARLTKGDVGLWFLKRDGSGDWSVLPFVTPPPARSLDDLRIPLAAQQTGNAYPVRSDASLADKALSEVLSAAEQDTTGRFFYMQWGAFDEPHPRLLERYYRRLLAGHTAAKSAQGLAGLIRLGRPEALVRLERDAQALAPYADQFAYSIAAYFRGDDAASVSALGRLATGASTPRTLRKGAAEALAFIHNVRSVPFLVSLMDSGDVEFETLGTGGLAMFANGVRSISRGGNANFSPSGAPGPYRSDETIRRFTLSVERFKSNRAANLAFWRSWWRRYQAEIVASAN